MMLFIPNKSINDLQRGSIRKLIDFAKGAKRVDIVVTVDGKQFHVQGDWLKVAQLATPEPEMIKPPTIRPPTIHAERCDCPDCKKIRDQHGS